jgi:hypothetical protein
MENSSEGMRKNAENCGELAERATTDHEKARFKRMERAWDNLADNQDWLNGDKTRRRHNGADSCQSPREKGAENGK